MTLGSSLSHDLFRYAADPLGGEAASAQGLSSTLLSSAQFRGVVAAIIDRNFTLGMPSPLARYTRASDYRPRCFPRLGL
jgi:hypothetical protein